MVSWCHPDRNNSMIQKIACADCFFNIVLMNDASISFRSYKYLENCILLTCSVAILKLYELYFNFIFGYSGYLGDSALKNIFFFSYIIMANPWISHVKTTMKKHKGKSFKAVLKLAKKSYKSKSRTKAHKSRKSHRRKSTRKTKGTRRRRR